ncbi:MAG: c-type cytochrome [Hyphomicrobiales bacterium]
MRPRVLLHILVALAAASATGCGWFGPPEPPPPIEPVTSIYDSGPRAGDAPYMPYWAVEGESLFSQKGCKACHAYGVRLTGPDLKGVTRLRSGEWMAQQILHPDIMTVEDPISIQLKAEYIAQMANVGLTPREAMSVIEYLKKLDEDTEARDGPHAFDNPTPPPFQAPGEAAPGLSPTGLPGTGVPETGAPPPVTGSPEAAVPEAVAPETVPPEALAPDASPDAATSSRPPS